MEPENEIPGISFRALGEVCPNNITSSTNGLAWYKVRYQGYNRLKILGTQFVLLMTLIFCLSTTIGTFWLILRLRLNEDITVVEWSAKDSPNNGHLVFNQDLVLDTLSPQAGLRMQRLIGDEFRITGFNKKTRAQAEILIDQDSIYMEAESYSAGLLNDQYSFKLSKKVDLLEIPNGINNIKVIRTPSSRRNLPVTEEIGDRPTNLHVSSPDRLELSGNMGIKAHSRSMYISSPKDIHIVSKEESITFKADMGLRLVSIPHKNTDDSLTEVNMTVYDMLSASNKDQSGEHQLCISRDDGRIYKTMEVC